MSKVQPEHSLGGQARHRSLSKAEQQVSSTVVGWAAVQGMVQVFIFSMADLADARVISDSVDAILGGKKLMKNLEKES